MQMVKSKLISLAVLLCISLTTYAKDNQPLNSDDKKEEIQDKLSRQFSNKAGHFEINTGQYPEELKYRFGSPTANVDFFADKVIFSLRKESKAIDLTNPAGHSEYEYIAWEIELNSSEKSIVTHELTEEVKGVNYFKNANAKASKKYITDKISYENIYENIDLVFYKDAEGNLKYDFILKAGARISDIELDYVGVKNMLLHTDGTLSYSTSWGIIKEDKPFSYRAADNSTIDIAYSLNGTKLSFISEIDVVTETIIIDPIYVDWSTYFYGTGNTTTGWSWTWVLDLDIDDSNNVYVTGMTNDRFPTGVTAYDTAPGGFYDAFVCKMAPDGDSIVWFSYIGGSSYEYSFTLTVNSAQEPVIAGFSWSSNFPTTPGAYDQTGGAVSYYKGFVTKFGKGGDSLVFSTFLGGSQSDLIHSMVLDAGGNLYITGETKSTDFPVTTGCFQSTYGGGTASWWTGGDAFLVKMNPNGTDLLFSTYIGGALDDVAYEVALSPSNEIYLVGKTASGNFPVTAGSSIFNYNVRGASDGFVMKFRTNGNTLVYSKLMGGDGADWFEGVYINGYDEAYIAGISESTNFYTTNKAYQKSSGGGADIVLVKMNALGQNVAYSTYLGGGSDEKYYSGWIYNSNVSVSVNVREEPIICGISRSNNFPITADALMKTNPSSVSGGWWNTSAVIAKLDYKGEKLLYGTYFGGSSYEIPGANKLKRISCYTNILYGGVTASSDYPTTSGVYKESKSTSSTGFFWTGFVSKFRDTLYTDIIDLALSDTIYECDNVFEILDVKNQGADILWSNGSTQRFEIIRDTGTYWVRATYGCDTVRDTIHFIKEYSPIVPVLPNDSIYCDIFPTVDLDAKNDSMLAVYTWSNGDSTQTTSINTPGNHWVKIETPHCGTKTDSVNYKLLLSPEVQLINDTVLCDSVNIVLQGGLANNEEIYSWNTGDSTASIRAKTIGTYQLKAENFCGVDSSQVLLELLHSPVAQLPEDTVFCDETLYELRANGRANNEETYLWADIDNSVIMGIGDSIDITTTGLYSLQATNRCGTSKDSIQIGILFSPSLDLGRDSIYCDTIEYTIFKGTSNNAESYLWDDNSTEDNRTIYSPGLYWLEIKNKCATVRDSIEFTQKYTPIADIRNAAIGSVEDSIFCDAVLIDLDASFNDPDAVYSWNTVSSSPTITATAVGKYIVSVSNYCGIAYDSVTFDLITSPTIELGDERVFCGAVVPFDISIGKADNQEKYEWSYNSATTGSITIAEAGKHWAKISNKCATVSDTLIVRISEYPVVDLGPDTILCGNFSIPIDAGNPGMRYSWEPYGETTQVIYANEQRVYKVTVTNADNCSSSDEFEVKGDCISHYYIPSAFSPNSDGKNDEFKASLINFENYEMKIFNRWGELLFQSNDPNEGWDGTYKGADVQQGVYLYQITLVTTEDLQHRNLSGVIHLLR